MNEFTEQSDKNSETIDILDQELEHHFENAVTRPIKPEEIEYVISQMPYLEMINLEFDEDKLVEPRLITAKTGWVIQDLQEAICSSPGDKMWSSSFADEDDDEGGGTIIYKSFNTAVEMVRLAEDLGWIGISVVGGNQIMKWAAWLEAENLGLAVHGFEPTSEDKKKLKRLGRSKDDIVRSISSMRLE